MDDKYPKDSASVKVGDYLYQEKHGYLYRFYVARLTKTQFVGNDGYYKIRKKDLRVVGETNNPWHINYKLPTKDLEDKYNNQQKKLREARLERKDAE